jgi:hypothetical protein
MKAAMAGMAPADALERGDVTFPKHATKERPPMFPLFKRAKVDLVSKIWADRKQETYWNQELPKNMLCVHAVHENELISERPATVNPTLLSMLSVIKPEEKEDLDIFADIQERLKDGSSERDQNQFMLCLEHGSSCLSDDSLPELEDAGSSSDVGTCPYCFDRQHASVMECPPQEISEATANQLIGITNLTQGTKSRPIFFAIFH